MEERVKPYNGFQILYHLGNLSLFFLCSVLDTKTKNLSAFFFFQNAVTIAISNPCKTATSSV